MVRAQTQWTALNAIALHLLAVSVAVSVCAAERSRPNVLIVLADQWRAEACGYAGNPDVKTPNLDRLRLEGGTVSFCNAISGVPVCCPARASLFTGQHAWTHGVFLNDVPLAGNAVTLAKTMREAGYETAYIGKWHLDGRGRSNFTPPERRQGFDFWRALECTHNYSNSLYYADTPDKLKWAGYDAFAQTRAAQEYLRERARSTKPFLLALAWGPPHDPYELAPAEFSAKYPPAALHLPPNVPPAMHPEARRMMSGYYAHCTALDACCGQLRQTLRETGLESNTLLVFTSDHGDLLGGHGARNKQQPYDESIRVPLLLHWPAGFRDRQPRVLPATISTVDLMPTLLSLCGVGVPASVEGLDFSGCIRGGKDPSGGAVLISCIAPFGQWTRARGGKEYRGLRTPRYTYVCDLNGPWLLFDNAKDPWQTNNLAGQPEAAKLQRQLHTQLQSRLSAAHDAFLPGDSYIRKWGYQVDATGTVPYQP
jgi:arylsulfatase A-like enzyme